MTISSTNTKDQHNGNGSATSFNYNFKILDQSHLEVIKTSTAGVDTTLTITTDYTVSGVGEDAGGSITLTGSAPVTGEKITIRRNQDFLQSVDLQNQGGFFAEVHEDAFDKQAMYALQNREEIDRALRAPVTDPTTSDMTLPIKTARLGTVLAFNATTGDPEAGPTIADTATLAAVTSDIATLADIEDGTDATDAIQTVAGISSNVTTVAGVSANVTTVAGISSDVTAVAGDATDIGTVATNISDVTSVADNMAEVLTADTNAATATTQAAAASTSATNAASSATTATTQASAASTSATNAASSATSASTSATNAASSATAAQAAQTAAEAAADNFDDTYLGAKASDPTVDNDGDALTEGDMYFNSTTDTMKVYDGSAWGNVALSSATVVTKTSGTGSAELPAGTTAQRDGSPSAGYLRWNTTDTSAEVYDGSAWAAVGGGNSTDKGLYEHSHTISANYSITSGNNALSASPVTINSGVSVTIPSGSTWVLA